MTSADVDAYISKSKKWRDEMAELRPILIDCGLDETIKWHKPCFFHEAGNIAIFQEMKQHLALLFFKGALLDDPNGVLTDQGPNSRSASWPTQLMSSDPVVKSALPQNSDLLRNSNDGSTATRSSSKRSTR